MSRARFNVIGRLDNAGRVQEGTVTIDRSSGIFTVRAKRRRRVFELPLGTVATLVVQSISQAEARERRRQKRRPRRRG